MFSKLQHCIPDREPDLMIGPLLLWVTGYTAINQIGQGDWAYLKTPTLLDTKNVIVFSENSETPVFVFREFLKGVNEMYETISNEQMVELASSDSQFSLKLENNNSGGIAISIEYNSWSSQNGSLELDDVIDQSYLPKIILDLKKIIEKFS